MSELELSMKLVILFALRIALGYAWRSSNDQT